jgi:hypothetical protein
MRLGIRPKTVRGVTDAGPGSGVGGVRRGAVQDGDGVGVFVDHPMGDLGDERQGFATPGDRPFDARTGGHGGHQALAAARGVARKLMASRSYVFISPTARVRSTNSLSSNTAWAAS